jgi:hypothetical protein
VGDVLDHPSLLLMSFKKEEWNGKEKRKKGKKGEG